MKYFIALVMVFSLAACGSQSGQSGTDVKPDLKDNTQKYSYSIGMDIAVKLAQQFPDLDSKFIVQGLKDGFAKNNEVMTPQDATKNLMAFQQEMMMKQQAEMEKLAKENLEAGQKFLEENKKKEGVKTTDSGLQIKVVNEGKGESPAMDDQVVINYSGKLTNGTEFDSSYKRKQPATFPLQGVIPGMSEALTMMKPGGKYQIFIPANLAYGKKAPSPAIGPNAVLVFDIELLDVKKAGKKAEKPAEPKSLDKVKNSKK